MNIDILTSKSVKNLSYCDYSIINGIVKLKGRVYIGKSSDLRLKAIQNLHDFVHDFVVGDRSEIANIVEGCDISKQDDISTYVGLLASFVTFQWRSETWDGYIRDHDMVKFFTAKALNDSSYDDYYMVKELVKWEGRSCLGLRGHLYVQDFDVSTRPKHKNSLGAELLEPSQIPNDSWSYFPMDFIGGLLESNGKDIILVVVDRFAKDKVFTGNYWDFIMMTTKFPWVHI